MKKIIRNRIILALTVSFIFLISVTSVSALAAPTVTTEPATNIDETSATLVASWDIDDEDEVIVWFEIDGGTTPQQSYTSSGTHTEDMTGLTPNTEYDYRAVFHRRHAHR